LYVDHSVSIFDLIATEEDVRAAVDRVKAEHARPLLLPFCGAERIPAWAEASARLTVAIDDSFEHDMSAKELKSLVTQISRTVGCARFNSL